MRIAELSRRSSVTVPTIKYYLREGLLPAGTSTGRNQASYGEEHLRRLQLIWALREVGGLSVTAAREVLSALDGPGHSRYQLMGHAAHAVIGPSPHDPADPEWVRARNAAHDWVRELGWRVEPDSPALDRLADVLLALHRLDQTQILDCLPSYAEGALVVAEQEVTASLTHPDPVASMTSVVTGTVLGGALLSAVRLLAHEHVAARIEEGAPHPAIRVSGAPSSTAD